MLCFYSTVVDFSTEAFMAVNCNKNTVAFITFCNLLFIVVRDDLELRQRLTVVSSSRKLYPLLHGCLGDAAVFVRLELSIHVFNISLQQVLSAVWLSEKASCFTSVHNIQLLPFGNMPVSSHAEFHSLCGQYIINYWVCH